ncbi:hypothetical protein [uncultured Selenomonas sp.]|uniref:hypothetical protein n=1 Tax=uncultured Selenomonas sp. TaxID=159275 RepID=UPI0025F14A04|nr:hypothetical protein [uncultured Selenomonas sp.]
MLVSKTMEEIQNEITKEDYELLEKAKNMPITFDEDCPELTDEQLKRAYRVKDGRPTYVQKENVMVPLNPWAFRKAKSLGKEYAEILSRILEDALRNPKIIEEYM